MNVAGHQQLLQRIQALSHPLKPEPTGVAGESVTLEGVRAVLFDVYGTLFVSAAGDISLGTVDSDERAARDALAAVDCKAGRLDDDVSVTGLFDAAIQAVHARLRSQGIEYPEVDIVAIWQAVLAQLPDAVVIGPVTSARLCRLAVEYEFRVNPVWPMPDLKSILAMLQRRGCALGLVSNAQFYTPLMFHALLGEPLIELGFDPALCAFSWQRGEAKPSTALFRTVLERLAGRYGIEPAQTLYVGNDRLKDIWPAHRFGCRTVLFAGDRRSLRLREGDARCAEAQPDHVITGLLGLSGSTEPVVS